MKQLLFIAILFLPISINAQSKMDTLKLGDLVINHYKPKIDSICADLLIAKLTNENEYKRKIDGGLSLILLMEFDANEMLAKIGCRRRVDALAFFKNYTK